MSKKNGIFKKTAKAIFYPEVVFSRRVKENIDDIKNFKTYLARKKSGYYSAETKNFDFWKESCNYTADNLQTNYRSYSAMSYLFFMMTMVMIYMLFITDNHLQILAIGAVFASLWHRCIFRAKIIKDFAMYTKWYAPFKKADDIFPNPFEPIKEKFSLIYEERITHEVDESDFY
ncbi:TPA: hypothetical protein ACGR6T_004742 [Klebsiella aerogenes]